MLLFHLSSSGGMEMLIFQLFSTAELAVLRFQGGEIQGIGFKD